MCHVHSAKLALALSALIGATATAAERRTDVVRAVERVSPAVVSVRTQIMVSERTTDPFAWFFRDFAAPRQRRMETSQGSGVIIDAKGFVLTNYHVVAVGGEVEIELVSGKRHPAEVVGTAPEHDLAVLRLLGAGTVPSIPMGTSRDLMIGETVIAIGNPFGLSHTVTTGVISALHRFIRTEERTYVDFIQTDASINPGNSGGPLLDINGQLIGVNTAVYGHAQGIGFAIPIDKARRIVDDLLRHGEVRRPYFGFDAQELTPELAESFRLSGVEGVLVSFVEPKGPADGRLQEGDVIVSLDGQRVGGRDDLRARLGDFGANTEVRLDVLRQGRPVAVTLTAATLDPKATLRLVESKLGIAIKELSASEASRYGLPAGIILAQAVSPASPAGRVGIRPGDWIRAVNSEKVVGTTAFAKAMAASYWRGMVTLLIQRGRVWQQVPFEF
jgi:Do/DeqQ family serine protease